MCSPGLFWITSSEELFFNWVIYCLKKLTHVFFCSDQKVFFNRNWLSHLHWNTVVSAISLINKMYFWTQGVECTDKPQLVVIYNNLLLWSVSSSVCTSYKRCRKKHIISKLQCCFLTWYTVTVCATLTQTVCRLGQGPKNNSYFHCFSLVIT